MTRPELCNNAGGTIRGRPGGREIRTGKTIDRMEKLDIKAIEQAYNNGEKAI